MSTSKTAYAAGWGSDQNARVVRGLTRDEREKIRAGGTVMLADCPSYKGHTTRRVVCIKGRFYARMPQP